MPFNYDPKDAENCWPVVGPDGNPIQFDATLKKVEDKISKSSGNEMQVLTFEVWSPDGKKQYIEEYVTHAGLFKLKQFSRALGKEDQFKAGKFQADDQVGSGIKVELIIESSAGFDDKNKIGKFIAAPTDAAAKPPAPRPSMKPQPSGVGAEVLGEEQQFKDDDIPF